MRASLGLGFVLAAVAMIASGCWLIGSQFAMQRPARMAEQVGVVVAMEEVQGVGFNARLTDGRVVALVQGGYENLDQGGTNVGSLLFAGEKPTPCRSSAGPDPSCPSVAPYSLPWVARIGDGYLDFASGLRVPLAPGFTNSGLSTESGTLVNGWVCLDDQGRAYSVRIAGA